MTSAKEFLARGERDAAVIQLKNLLTSTPENGEARLLLGQALLDGDDFASAEKELGRALELKQPQEKVLPSYLQALLAQGKYQDVVAAVEKYKLFSPPAVATTQTALGDAYVRLGNAAGARDAYAKALAAVPGHSRARLGEAVLTMADGRLDEAMKQLDEIIAADATLAEAHALRADILLAQRDRAGARKALEGAVAANPRFVPARLGLVGLLTEEREFDAAASQLDQTRKVAPRDLRIGYYDAALAFQKGETDRARQQIQQVLKYLPDHVPSLLLAASIEVRSNRLALAEEHLRTVVGRAPGHATARRILAATQLRMGQPARAMETLKPLLDQGMPQDPQLLLVAGETYLANGDAKQATAFYEAAAKEGQAQGAVAKTRLGQIAMATGRTEEGFRELEAASELDAGQYQADLAIIAGHLRRNEADKAMAAAQALEKKQPTNPLTFQMYGLVHLAKRDVPAARRNFEKALELQPSYLPAAHNLSVLDLAEKRPEEARKRYEAMIARDAKNDQLYLALADLQVRVGDEAKAIGETIQRAVAANPQSVPARLALISFHLRSRDAKAALTVAQSAVAAMPSDPRVLEAAAAAQEAAGEINQAIGTINKLASLQPQSVQPLYRLVALHMRQKEADKAVEALRRVQKVAPQDRRVVPELVMVYLADKRPDEALKEARALQAREPKSATGHSLEGDIHLAQRRFPEAERAFREALKLEPRANAVALRLHGALAAAGKQSEADAFAKQWMAANPKDGSMRLYLGDRELAARNLKAAVPHYQAVLAIDPNHVVALNNLAWTAGELGDPKALGYAQRAVKLAPNNAAVLDTIGMLLVRKGDGAEGLRYLEQARKIAPNRNDLRMNYAKALVRLGRKDDARKELEALQAVPEDFRGKNEIESMLKSL